MSRHTLRAYAPCEGGSFHRVVGYVPGRCLILERSIQGASQREIAAVEQLTQGAISKILRRAEDRVLRELAAVVEQQKARQALRLDYVYCESVRAW